eukprot:CAMPEP_0113935692 /NCGR_PEP_ID=MMETSP1339-20121228/2797_1 /TAXON_ID=94617 /ORGANISM="Fibrocapsa japonica" /LENGTH=175 /DNA_ID=CAMNT_0000937927 /DNA_START=181 /DNA_END=708 /DNA_ORIENTATION=- /assembly_acc=CAM_ASM_000762
MYGLSGLANKEDVTSLIGEDLRLNVKSFDYVLNERNFPSGDWLIEMQDEASLKNLCKKSMSKLWKMGGVRMARDNEKSLPTSANTMDGRGLQNVVRVTVRKESNARVQEIEFFFRDFDLDPVNPVEDCKVKGSDRRSSGQEFFVRFKNSQEVQRAMREKNLNSFKSYKVNLFAYP